MYVAKFPKKEKDRFPRRLTNSELWSTTDPSFWRKYTLDLANYNYSPSRKNFETYFTKHTYGSWSDAKKSYNRLMKSKINGKEPEVPYDLIHKEAWEHPIETLDSDSLLQRVSIDTYRIYSNWDEEINETKKPSLDDLLSEIGIEKKVYCRSLNKILTGIENKEKTKSGLNKYANIIHLYEIDNKYIESLIEQCKYLSTREVEEFAKKGLKKIHENKKKLNERINE